METILNKISIKYNIPNDIIYLISIFIHNNNLKNINESIKNNEFKLNKLEENKTNRLRLGKWMWIFERRAFHKARYDEKLLISLIHLKQQLYSKSNRNNRNKTYMYYFGELYHINKEGWASMTSVRALENCKYI